MLFNSNVFLFAFLPAVFTLFWVGRTKQQRYLLLTVASYIFYGWWDWRFCFLLLCSSLVSFASGLLIEDAPTARRRRGILAVAVSL
ncbi:MAG TPA: MBOAT family protein, partial [Methylomirabilota bacterium]